MLYISLSVGFIIVTYGFSRTTDITDRRPNISHLIVYEVVHILNRRTVLCALHSYHLSTINNITIGIFSANLLFYPYTILIVVIIDILTVHSGREHLPSHLPSKTVISSIIIGYRITDFVIGDRMPVICCQKVAPCSVVITIGIFYICSRRIRALCFCDISEAIIGVTCHERIESNI